MVKVCELRVWCYAPSLLSSWSSLEAGRRHPVLARQLDRRREDRHQVAGPPSHAPHRNTTISSVLTVSVWQSLVLRLTSVGKRQLPALLALVGDVVLSEAVDTREQTRCRKKTGSLDASAMHKLRTWHRRPFPRLRLNNFAPLKAKFFAWLLSSGRTSSPSLRPSADIPSSPGGCKPHLP
jgi:hypothetical protein